MPIIDTSEVKGEGEIINESLVKKMVEFISNFSYEGLFYIVKAKK